ncbi:MAG: 50S ribosomal protein L35ae [Candidatus Jordarchaeaceae archaeon]
MSDDTVTSSRKGIIKNYVQGIRTQRNNCMLIKIQGIESDKDAAKFIGKKVIWQAPSGKRISGKIVKVHGKNGVVRAYFKHGLPGHSLGTEIKIT